MALLFLIASGAALAALAGGMEEPAVSSEGRRGPVAVETSDHRVPASVGMYRTDLQDRIHRAHKAEDFALLSRLESLVPAQNMGGEAGYRFARPESTSVAGPGDRAKSSGGLQPEKLAGPQSLFFSAETGIRFADLGSREWNPSMVQDSNGIIYIVFQDTDPFLVDPDYIQFYSSQDGGLTWSAIGFIANLNADLMEPSLAIAEGTQDSLIVAYIVDDGVNPPFPEVAVATLGTTNFTMSNPAIVPTWEGYAKPVLWTDAVDWNNWTVYLTAEGIFDSVAENINVVTWRSTDFTGSWSPHNTVLGNFDTDAWTYPDGSYGTTMDRAFVCCYNDTDGFLYHVASDDFGQSYNPEVSIRGVPGIHILPVNPEIAAAVNDPNVMVACTFESGGINEVGYIYSSDSGTTWTAFIKLPGSTGISRHTPEMIADESGMNWHLAYTSSPSVYYSARPQDLSALWQSSPDLVNSGGLPSTAFPKKGITVNGTTGHPAVCWADFRDGIPDYDILFSFAGSLVTDNKDISKAVGGTANFTLNAGAANAGRNCIILGSVTGTTGIPLPGGQAVLPLRWDLFTSITIDLANTPTFQNFIGKLDGAGIGSATLNLPPIPGGGLPGMFFAFALNNPWNFVSNAVLVELGP